LNKVASRILLPCRHASFCYDCIEKSIQAVGPRCPICKTRINSHDPICIFLSFQCYTTNIYRSMSCFLPTELSSSSSLRIFSLLPIFII
jgi:hypothetical protein